MNIKNIFCIERNYENHAKELRNETPKTPIVFLKPTYSLANISNNTLKLPLNQGIIHYEIEIVLYIGKKVPNLFQVDDIVTKMALGVDFTLRDVQTDLKNKGYPWLLAKGFRNSAAVTEFWDFPGVTEAEKTDFFLVKNNTIVQEGLGKSMIFNFQNVLEYINKNFGLQEGDIIFTGTPEGVGSISAKDQYILKWGSEIKGSFIIDQIT